nr:hypothetical protein NNONMNKP_00116 [Oryctes rhinoceros nudivirus]
MHEYASTLHEVVTPLIVVIMKHPFRCSVVFVSQSTPTYITPNVSNTLPPVLTYLSRLFSIRVILADAVLDIVGKSAVFKSSCGYDFYSP